MTSGRMPRPWGAHHTPEPTHPRQRVVATWAPSRSATAVHRHIPPDSPSLSTSTQGHRGDGATGAGRIQVPGRARGTRLVLPADAAKLWRIRPATDPTAPRPRIRRYARRERRQPRTRPQGEGTRARYQGRAPPHAPQQAGHGGQRRGGDAAQAGRRERATRSRRWQPSFGRRHQSKQRQQQQQQQQQQQRI